MEQLLSMVIIEIIFHEMRSLLNFACCPTQLVQQLTKGLKS
jgi:hypothetical protein